MLSSARPTATTWARNHVDPSSEAYQNTVPRPKSTIVAYLTDGRTGTKVEADLISSIGFRTPAALFAKGQYADALVSLVEANKIYNSDIQVLNALGVCYWKTGQKQQALEALNASLKLDLPMGAAIVCALGLALILVGASRLLRR